MNTQTNTSLAQSASETADHVADQLAAKAHDAVSATRRRANGALDSIDSGVDEMRHVAAKFGDLYHQR